jgi:hypothetical protein
MEDKKRRIQEFNAKQRPVSLALSLPLPPDTTANLECKAAALSRSEFPSAETLFPFWEEYLTCRQQNAIDDDSVEVLYPNQYDQGIYGAMFGAEMHFLIQSGWGWASSSSKPFEEKTYKELLALRFDPGNPWLQRMKRDLAYLAERSRGRFDVTTIITIDGFNFAHQIRGMRLFEDIYDRPDELKALLNLAADINIEFVEFQRNATAETCEHGSMVLGGHFPGHTVAMSVDTYNMCSSDTYLEFGMPYQQRLIDHFGGGAFHLHGNGRHLLPAMAKLSGFVYVSIHDDGAQVRAFDDRANLGRLAGNLLIGLSCGKQELSKALSERTLVPARYHVPCADRHEAQSLLEQFRNYRA